MDVLMDKEGVDVSEWLLQEHKRFVEILDEDKMIERYNNDFNIMKLFPHLINENSSTQSQEQKIIKEFYINKNKGNQNYTPFLEEIKFDLTNKKNHYKFPQFWEDLRKILKKQYVE